MSSASQASSSQRAAAPSSAIGAKARIVVARVRVSEGDPRGVQHDVAPGAQRHGPIAPRVEVRVALVGHHLGRPSRVHEARIGDVRGEADPSVAQVDLPDRARTGLPERVGGQLRVGRRDDDLHDRTIGAHPYESR